MRRQYFPKHTKVNKTHNHPWVWPLRWDSKEVYAEATWQAMGTRELLSSHPLTFPKHTALINSFFPSLFRPPLSPTNLVHGMGMKLSCRKLAQCSQDPLCNPQSKNLRPWPTPVGMAYPQTFTWPILLHFTKISSLKLFPASLTASVSLCKLPKHLPTMQ